MGILLLHSIFGWAVGKLCDQSVRWLPIALVRKDRLRHLEDCEATLKVIVDKLDDHRSNAKLDFSEDRTG